MKHIFLLSALLATSAWGQNEPWQDPQVNSIGREPMSAHFLPYVSSEAAWAQYQLPADRRYEVNSTAERRRSLDGTWLFHFSKNPQEAPKGFEKPGASTRGWSRGPAAGHCKASMHLFPLTPHIPSLPIRPLSPKTIIP